MRSYVIASCSLACVAIAACSNAPDPGGDVAATSSALGRAPVRQVPQSPNPYTLFETLQVRPLALSPDGRTLYAANTPDNRLEIFNVQRNGLDRLGSVEVGLEPVAVAVRGSEIWVVNHLSDSVSIVDASDPFSPRVTRTLMVGDEPRDIVFAGPRHDRAFITTAHRGQDSPDDPDLFAPGVGRADVWVFDANNLGAAPGGQRLTKLTFFADTPRALAATPDGRTVYAAAFFSGNQTTVASEGAVSQAYPNGMPGPATVAPAAYGGAVFPQPQTGLVVKWKKGAPDGQYHWLDAYGTVFDPWITMALPDQDVFAIDATQATPAAAATNSAFTGVGTTLFNMAVNPVSGKIYVSNTDAHNDVRFEGDTAHNQFTSVEGNIVDSRISTINPSTGAVTTANLNTHLDPVTHAGNPALSVAFPQDLAVSPDGRSLAVVAQGSGKLALYDTASIESATVVPNAANQVALTGGGPTGVVVAGNLAVVLTRFDDGLSVVDLGSKKETAHVTMFSPEPASVTAGRKFLYSAATTSANGTQACASCHIGGDLDGLAWDLGNPNNIPLSITTAFAQESDVRAVPEAAIIALLGSAAEYLFAYYQPVKGPMTTQSLRGLDNHGAMHWRGDRNGAVQQSGLPFLDSTGNPVVSAQPNSGMFDEVNAFKSFNVAFPGLVGDSQELSDADMTAFTSFTLQMTYPPNPIRNLDNSLTPGQQAGQTFYFNNIGGTELPVDRFHDCNGCHVLDRNGNAGSTARPGFFGTDGRLSFENETQTFKVPHLRNAYQKLGMYGTSIDQTHAVGSLVPGLNPGLQADGSIHPIPAVRGFGFQHDGATATVDMFLTAFVFIQANTNVTFGGIDAPPNPYGIPLFQAGPLDPSQGLSAAGYQLRQEVASFVLAFDSNLFPIVGKETTLTAANAAASAARIALLEAQAQAGSSDLIARGSFLGFDIGFVYQNGAWLSDTALIGTISDAALRKLVGRGIDALTFTAVPPGEGLRLGVDRDGDGYADGDEILAGSNPADAKSTPR